MGLKGMASESKPMYKMKKGRKKDKQVKTMAAVHPYKEQDWIEETSQ